MHHKILLTGVPGVGKTTIIKEIARLLGRDAAGFYTEERRYRDRRVGFDIITLDGRTAALSHVDIKGKNRVGKYGVDLDAIDSVAVPAIEAALAGGKTVIVDEIGKMELFSRMFRESVLRALDSPNPMVAVIMLKSNSFADSVKRRTDVKIIEVTLSNRDALANRIVSELG